MNLPNGFQKMIKEGKVVGREFTAFLERLKEAESVLYLFEPSRGDGALTNELHALYIFAGEVFGKLTDGASKFGHNFAN